MIKHTPSDIVVQPETPQLDQVDFTGAVLEDKKIYLKALKKWQKAMQQIQQAYYHQNRRAIIVFEGWDASGKGGAIRRFTENLDPRGFQVYPIAAPTAEEQGRHYLYRFQSRLPATGTMAIFDRSWYGRVLVERVESFADEEQWQRAYQEINEFERMMVDDGVRIVKLFLHISRKEQTKRFEERLNNPAKQWKLTQEDIRNHKKWDHYEKAVNDMFRYTSTEAAPWHLIPANKKWFACIEVIKTIVNALSEGVDVSPPPLCPQLLAAAQEHLGIDLED
jgi:PPK2 family polyphosphate:nucleotide phosphotransferase